MKHIEPAYRTMALTGDKCITVKVELFGTCRLRSGRDEVSLVLTPDVSRRDLLQTLARACPSLVGSAIREDLSGLEDGYLLNLNGTAFLSGEMLTLRAGDSLLLLSSQAGG